jgi:hypothetical protein
MKSKFVSRLLENDDAKASLVFMNYLKLIIEFDSTENQRNGKIQKQ